MLRATKSSPMVVGQRTAAAFANCLAQGPATEPVTGKVMAIGEAFKVRMLPVGDSGAVHGCVCQRNFYSRPAGIAWIW